MSYINETTKALHQKFKRGEITKSVYENELAKAHGFKNFHELRNRNAIRAGFKSQADRLSNWRHKKGLSKPMSEDKECSNYLGIHIAERVLSHVFESVTRMPNNNPGYDFICKKGYKIDVKSSALRVSHKKTTTKKWDFTIRRNKIADYFILLAFDNRTDLNPLHIWLIKGEEIIREKKLNNMHALAISELQTVQFEKYRKNSEIDKVIVCCTELHGE